MKKVFLLMALFLTVNSVNAEKVKDQPPKSGTAEHFVVSFIQNINNKKTTLEEFKKDYCTENLIKVFGSSFDEMFEEIKNYDLKSKFEYRVSDKGKYIEVRIKTKLDTKNQSIYYSVKKINGSFKWVDEYKD